MVSVPCGWWLSANRLRTQHLNSIRLASVELVLAAIILLLPSIASSPDVFLPVTIAALAILGFEINKWLSGHINVNGPEIWNRDVDAQALISLLSIKAAMALASALVGLRLLSSDGIIGSLTLALASFSLYFLPLASLSSSRTSGSSVPPSPPHPPLQRLISKIRKSEDSRRRNSSEELMRNVRGLFSSISGSINPDSFNSIPLIQLRELAQSRMKEDIELDIEEMSFLQLVKLTRGEHVPREAIKAKSPPASRLSSTLTQHKFTTPENIGIKASKHSNPAPPPPPPPPPPPSPPPSPPPHQTPSSTPMDDGPWKDVVELLWAHSSEVAHDMKNPLSGVLALSQNVIAGVFGELPKGAQDQMHVVRACAYHLLNMINMLRDMMKMLASGQADMSINKVGLDGPVEEIMGRMSPMVGNRMTIHWEKTPPEEVALRSVLADDQRLYQVLHCVIANAFKYTRKGSVHIESELLSDKRYLAFRVIDTGTGLSQEQLDKFNKVPPSHFNKENVKEQIGLGLVMVRRIMAEFGGALRISNNKREGGGQGPSGATVELLFRTDREAPPVNSSTGSGAAGSDDGRSKAKPLVKPTESLKGGSGSGGAKKRLSAAGSSSGPVPPPPPAPQPANTKNASQSLPSLPSLAAIMKSRGSNASVGSVGEGGMGFSNPLTNAKILIVDDDPINLTILEDLLGNEGYLLVTAANGTEALEVYMTTDPPVQLVLLDVTLPDMSGHEVCLKMRSLTPGVPPPIIMISGKASTKDVIKGLQAGSCDYITKPFQPQEVLARVETQIRLFTGEVGELQEQAERSMALLTQVLPPHILSSLKGGNRVLVERAQDVCVLVADIASFTDLTTHSDASDGILALNKIYCTFDTLIDKFGVHKIDIVNDAYVAAIGHLREDNIGRSSASQAACILECCKEMMDVVRTMTYPASLGRLELRIGVHIGPVFTGILGIKFPRYSFFGSTIKLASALNRLAPPMTVHVSDVVQGRASKGPTNERFVPFTQSSFPGMGVFRTHLLMTPHLNVNLLQAANVVEFLNAAANNASALGAMQVMQSLIGSPNTSTYGSLTMSVASPSMPGGGLSRYPTSLSNASRVGGDSSMRSVGSNLFGPMFSSVRVSRDGGGQTDSLSRQSTAPSIPFSNLTSSIQELPNEGPEPLKGDSTALGFSSSSTEEKEDRVPSEMPTFDRAASAALKDLADPSIVSGALDGLIEAVANNSVPEDHVADLESAQLASGSPDKGKRRNIPVHIPSFRFNPTIPAKPEAAEIDHAYSAPGPSSEEAPSLADQLVDPIVIESDPEPEPKKKPANPSELLASIGLDHYAPKIEAHLVAAAAKGGVQQDHGEDMGSFLLARMASMDDDALKKAGIITDKARRQIKEAIKSTMTANVD